MMCPPQSVKIVSTPSFFSALATRWPPEATPASRLFLCRVSSAVLDFVCTGTGFTVAISPPNCLMVLYLFDSRGPPATDGARRRRCIGGPADSEVASPHRLENDERQHC